MKKFLTIALLIIFALAAPAYAEEPGVIVQSSCSIVESGEYYLVYCFARVHNNSDQVLCLDEGTFQIFSGEEPVAVEDVSQLWPYFVAPGADGYLFDIVPFESMPQVTGLEYTVRYLTINSAYAGEALDTQSYVEIDDESGEMSVVCEISNPTDADAYNAAISIGLYTDAGQMVYADGRNLQDVGIPAGGKVLVRFGVESALAEQWMSYDALPTQVHTNAMFRTSSD
ncbi:MAG: hypothetical protein E7321_08380 [Clostridiales bacterium]|nr:hypothetical protein [Clostridiales bacterium]